MLKEEKLSMIFNKVSERHSLIKNIAEKKFISEHSFIEVHCIEQIEKIEDPNVTKLANFFKMTRGAISKIVKKLIDKGAVEVYRKPDNRKEKYYKLTDIGMAIHMEHEKMHRSRIERDSIFFSQLSEEEKDNLINTLNKVYTEIAKELKRLGMEDYI